MSGDRWNDEDVARLFHDTYERLAPGYGYRTREASAVPWELVPEANRALMIATVAEVRAVLVAPLVESATADLLVRCKAVLDTTFYPGAHGRLRTDIATALALLGDGDR